MLEISIKLGLATLLGALIGMGGYMHGRVAGLRTHILVTAGATLFTLISIQFSELFPPEIIQNEPSRIAAQILTGIGFIGAGVIIKTGFSVTGITTAASLWISAAVGMAIGTAFYFPAGLATALTFVTLNVLNRLEHRWKRNFYRSLSVTLKCDEKEINKIFKILNNTTNILHYNFSKNYRDDLCKVLVTLRIYGKGMVDEKAPQVIREIESQVKGVEEVKWEGA